MQNSKMNHTSQDLRAKSKSGSGREKRSKKQRKRAVQCISVAFDAVFPHSFSAVGFLFSKNEKKVIGRAKKKQENTFAIFNYSAEKRRKKCFAVPFNYREP